MEQWAKQLGCDPVGDGVMVVRIDGDGCGLDEVRMFWNHRECQWDWCNDQEPTDDNGELVVICAGDATPASALAALRKRCDGFRVEVVWALGVDIGAGPCIAS